MKRLLTGALAALTIAGGFAATATSAQAQSWGGGGYSDRGDYRGDYRRGDRDDYRRGDRGDYRRGDRGYRGDYRRYGRGEYAPRHWRSRDRYVDYRRHHLRAPPRGYGWVRGDHDEYLMIALTTGLIASVIAGY